MHIKEKAVWQHKTSNNRYSLQACPTFSSKDLQINPKMGTLTEAHLEYAHKHTYTLKILILNSDT